MLVWVKHVPAAALSSEDDREAAEFVEPSTNVKRNSVMLRANLVEVPNGGEDMTAVVAAYYVGTDGNGTETVRNLTVRRQQVSFEPGFSQTLIDLPQVDGRPKKVTMWLKTQDGQTVGTWHFKHRSSATTRSAPLDSDASMGDLASWGFVHIGIPILIGGVGGVLIGFAFLKRAYTGPGSGGVGTLMILSVPIAFVLMLTYFNLVELFVTNSVLFAIPASVMLLLLTVIAAPGTQAEKGLLFRPSVTEVESPSGDEGVDFESARDKVIKLVNADGQKAVVKDGWIQFLARIYGGAAIVDNWSEAKALTRLDDSAHEWWHVLSPSSAEEFGDDLFGYERPTLTITTPDSLVSLATRGGIALFAGLVGWQIYPGTSVLLGLISFATVAVLVSLDGEDGYAHIPFGSKHHRRAYSTAVTLATEMDAADSVEESEKKRMQEKATTERKSREKAAAYESAFVGEMLGTEIDMDDLVDAPGNEGASGQSTTLIEQVRNGSVSVEQALEQLAPDDEPSGRGDPVADGGEER